MVKNRIVIKISFIYKRNQKNLVTTFGDLNLYFSLIYEDGINLVDIVEVQGV